MKHVYYHNDKLGVTLSAQEVNAKIKRGEEKVEYLRMDYLDSTKTEKYVYKLIDISIHPDWTTIVNDELSFTMEDLEDMLCLTYEDYKHALALKLMNNMRRLKKIEKNGIKFT